MSSYSRFERNQKPSASNVITDADSWYECCICLEVAKDPVAITCGHFYCWKCIDMWLSDEKSDGRCPVCKKVISRESDIIPLYGKGPETDGVYSKPRPQARVRVQELGSSSNTQQRVETENTLANALLIGGAAVVGALVGALLSSVFGSSSRSQSKKK
ncbi:hypothetical protein AB6A40_004852 [Gnathostoma spinigerum]|uniref:RING-type E3 ubiquitin transferase n=1 Tax=Gnathostoma spinigerum TaxID=75299 RepID=A0ABD6EDR1_9BILA